MDSQVGTKPWLRIARGETRSSIDVRGIVLAAGTVLIVVAAEVVFLAAGLLAGAVAALAAVSLLFAFAGLRRGRPDGDLALALSVIPLLRALSIALPSLLVPRWAWYAEIGVPVIVSTLLAARVIGLGPADLGIRRAPPADIALLAGGGLLLGFLAVQITAPASVLADRSLVTAVLATIGIVLGSAVAEELLFRGLLLEVTENVVAGSGVLVTTALSTLVYIATLNVRYVLFMGAVALVLAVVTRRSGSVLPAIACHGTLVWSQLILWPAILA